MRGPPGRSERRMPRVWPSQWGATLQRPALSRSREARGTRRARDAALASPGRCEKATTHLPDACWSSAARAHADTEQTPPFIQERHSALVASLRRRACLSSDPEASSDTTSSLAPGTRRQPGLCPATARMEQPVVDKRDQPATGVYGLVLRPVVEASPGSLGSSGSSVLA